MRNKLLLACVVVALATILNAGCRSEQTPPNTIAKVGNRFITLTDYKKKLREYNLAGETPSANKEIASKVLNDLIERELLLIEAERRNILVAKSELEKDMRNIAENYPGQEFEKMLVKQQLTLEEWKQDLSKAILLRKVFERVTDEPVEISEEEIKAHYEENQQMFLVPETVRALHILVDSEKEAFEVLSLLRKRTPFETVARERSLGPEAQKGGDLGYFPRGTMPTIFDDTIFSLKVGKISRVVSSDYGYHIFKLIDRRVKKQRPLNDCREEIRSNIFKEKRKVVYTNWLEQQLKSTKILKNRNLIAKLG